MIIDNFIIHSGKSDFEFIHSLNRISLREPFTLSFLIVILKSMADIRRNIDMKSIYQQLQTV